MHRGRTFGRLHVTTTHQGREAPWVDGAVSVVQTSDDSDKVPEGTRYGGIAIRLPLSGEAVVLGWRDAGPFPTWRLRRYRWRLVWAWRIAAHDHWPETGPATPTPDAYSNEATA